MLNFTCRLGHVYWTVHLNVSLGSTVTTVVEKDPVGFRSTGVD